MADGITIRKLGPNVHDALRRRAAAAGRSMEAEAREILRVTCLKPLTEAEVAELRERARKRTAGRPQSDSTEIIRQARDER